MTEATARQKPAFSDFQTPVAPVRLQLLTIGLALLVSLSLAGPFLSSLNLAITGEGSPVRQGSYFAVVALIIVGLRPLGDPRRLLTVPWPITAALAWCLLTVTWALDPDIAIRRLLLTAMIIWSIFATVPWLGYQRTLTLLRVLLVIAVVASYLAVLVWPSFGIHTIDEDWDKKLIGDWRGIFLHKNMAGAVTALTVLAFAFDRRSMPRWLQLGIVAAAGFFLYKSGSRTSLGVCLIALVSGFLFVKYHARYRVLVIIGTVIVACVAAIYVNLIHDPFTQSLNDPQALTGRTLIWSSLWKFSEDNPMGAGFGSFWNIGENGPIYQYATSWVLEVKQGHNGFLDLIVTIGWPGLLIVLAAVVVMPLIRLMSTRQPLGERGALVLAMIAFCVAHNGTETNLFERDVIVQVFLMLALAMLWAITGTAPGQPPARRVSARPRTGHRSTR